MAKIVVGMSGGVDSSVAALLLKEEGHEVVGVSMRLFSCNRVQEGSCCTEQDRHDARRVCAHLGIAHQTVDLSAIFREKVIEPFVEEYLAGRTPSPCIRCNEHLKFEAFHDEASRLGADLIATGHYARIVPGDRGRRYLVRGVDVTKDQSYFLFPALRGALEHLRFPVGDLSKDKVRAVARERGLPVHDKGESQEVCFVPDDDYPAFIEEFALGRVRGPGSFVDMNGTVLGRHRGIHAYTVGQRRGLGIGFGRRLYVVRIDVENNEVVLGEDEDLHRREMRVRDLVWAGGDVRQGNATVQIRSRHTGNSACIEPIGDDAATVVFDEPERAIAPGQAAVFYDGDCVIGGGWIER